MKDTKTPNLGEEMILDSESIVVDIPKTAVELTITAKIYCEDGSTQKVEKRMTLAEIREAVEDARVNYIPPDATYELTARGHAYADLLRELDSEVE